MIKINDKTYRIMWQGKPHRLPITNLHTYAAFSEVGTFGWSVPEDGNYEITLSGGCVFSDRQNNVYKKGELITKIVTLSKGDQTTIQIGKAGNNKYKYKTGGKNGTWHTIEATPSGDSVFSYGSNNVTAKGASGDTYYKYESNNDGAYQQGYCFVRRVR